jgi:uncharacterized protein (TIGR03067 family)
MRSHFHVLLGLVVVASVAAPAGTAEDAKSELEGTWDLVRVERDGMELKPQKATQMITTGNKFVVKAGDEIVVAGTTKLDPGKKPKAVDVTYTEGPDKGKTFKGIYELEGDTARFCRAGTPEQERPTVFQTKPGTGALASTYHRGKR